ncbi:MAG: M23 family metallopeptidase, partial [Marmoricola sp.]
MGLLAALLSAASLVLSTAAASPPPAPSVVPSPAALRGVWPVQPPTVVRGFEPPVEAWTAGHRGADLASTIGSPVVASLAGTITFAGVVAGRGVVVINHGDTRTTYEPVIADVKGGDEVRAGDRIGTLDVAQSHCFPVACLH